MVKKVNKLIERKDKKERRIKRLLEQGESIEKLKKKRTSPTPVQQDVVASQHEIEDIKEEGSPSDNAGSPHMPESEYQEANASMLDELREEMEDKYREKTQTPDFEQKKYLQQQQRKAVEENEFLPFNLLALVRSIRAKGEDDPTQNISVSSPREF